MSDYWYGLYLKSTIERTRLEFVQAFEDREYILEQEYNAINEDTLSKFGSQQYYWETHILLVLTQINHNWVQILGLENIIYFPVKPLSISTLIDKIACDAFLCGYNSSYFWWYEYYEEDKIIDRFNSHPFDDFLDRYWLDEADPRSIYNREIGNKTNSDFPKHVYDDFKGNPQKLNPIIREDSSAGAIEKLFVEIRPDSAVWRLSKIIDLPLIGKFTSEMLLSLIYHWIESGGGIDNPPEILTPIIENKTSMLAFQKPEGDYYDFGRIIE
jgi:hypothetical protein